MNTKWKVCFNSVPLCRMKNQTCEIFFATISCIINFIPSNFVQINFWKNTPKIAKLLCLNSKLSHLRRRNVQDSAIRKISQFILNAPHLYTSHNAIHSKWDIFVCVCNKYFPPFYMYLGKTYLSFWKLKW